MTGYGGHDDDRLNISPNVCNPHDYPKCTKRFKHFQITIFFQVRQSLECTDLVLI